MTDETYIAPSLPREARQEVEVNAERQPVVTAKDGEAFANSRDVAAFFGKEHRGVLRDIDNLIAAEAALGLHSFVHTPYIEPQNGQTYRSFDMTRDGFTLLAMGFNGAKALKWKLKYIEAFNVMEAQLRRPQTLPDYSDPKVLLGAFQHLQAKVAEKDAQIAEQGTRLVKLERIEAADGSMCFTDAAKMLKVRPRDFIQLLQAHDWIYRRVGGPLIGYQSKVQAGLLEHTEYRSTDGEGHERVHVQCRVTAKGLVKAAELLTAQKH